MEDNLNMSNINMTLFNTSQFSQVTRIRLDYPSLFGSAGYLLLIYICTLTKRGGQLIRDQLIRPLLQFMIHTGGRICLCYDMPSEDGQSTLNYNIWILQPWDAALWITEIQTSSLLWTDVNSESDGMSVNVTSECGPNNSKRFDK